MTESDRKMTSSDQVSAKAFEQYAWVLVAAVGVLSLLSGVYLAAYGRPGPGELAGFSTAGTTWDALRTSDPGLADYVTQLFRFLGLIFVAASVFFTVISVTAYRRGERWAWYVLWTFPVLFVPVMIIDLTSAYPHTWQAYTVFLILALFGLLLPIRIFFKRDFE